MIDNKNDCSIKKFTSVFNKDFLKKNSFEEYLTCQLLYYFSIRLANLEQSFLLKDKNLTCLMFTMHDMSNFAQELKVENFVTQKKSLLKKNRNEEDLNTSNHTNMSKMVSLSKFNKKDFFRIKTIKEKIDIITKAVAINIGNFNKKDFRKMRSLESKKSIDHEDFSSLKPKIMTKEIKIVNKDREKCSSPLRLNKENSQENGIS